MENLFVNMVPFDIVFDINGQKIEEYMIIPNKEHKLFNKFFNKKVEYFLSMPEEYILSMPEEEISIYQVPGPFAMFKLFGYGIEKSPSSLIFEKLNDTYPFITPNRTNFRSVKENYEIIKTDLRVSNERFSCSFDDGDDFNNCEVQDFFTIYKDDILVYSPENDHILFIIGYDENIGIKYFCLIFEGHDCSIIDSNK